MPRVPDTILTCAGCGKQTLQKGGDWQGWKAIQDWPSEVDMLWYCTNEACQEARDQRFDEIVAAMNGLDDDSEEEGEAEAEEEPELTQEEKEAQARDRARTLGKLLGG